jgi:hypothetical protein
MDIELTQAELKEFANWCIDHLSVDFKDCEDGLTVMYFGSISINSATVCKESGDVLEYHQADTRMARQCYDLYTMWRNYQ